MIYCFKFNIYLFVKIVIAHLVLPAVLHVLLSRANPEADTVMF